MKHLKSILFSTIVLLTTSLLAQENKGITANELELLKILNSLDGFDLDQSKQSAFKDLNNSFVEELKNLSKSSFSKKEKEAKFNDLLKKRESNLQSLFGSNSYEEYIERLKRKSGRQNGKPSGVSSKWSYKKLTFQTK